MNERDRLDRMLDTWTDETWSPPPPAYLGDVLARTRHTRQRPAWASLERWLPMELTLRRPLAVPLRLLAIVLALLLLLVAAMSVPFLIGSRSLPATVVGEVRNGLVAFGKDGDIWVVDPDVGEPRVLIGGQEWEDGPGWSPDGTRIMFLRSLMEGSSATLMVAEADGSAQRPVTTDGLNQLRTYWWSPDGTQVALVSNISRYPSLSLVDVPEVGAEPTSMRTVDLGFPVSDIHWDPDGTSLIVRGGTADGTALFRVGLADGAAAVPIARSAVDSPFYAGDRGVNDLMEPVVSPDGSRIAYIQGQDPVGGAGVFGAPDTRIHIMDADGANDRLVEVAPGSDYEDGHWFSPDGTRLSIVVRTGGDHQLAIVPVDGTSDPVITAPVADDGGLPSVWAPDGSRVLTVRDIDGIATFVDATTGASTVAPWLAGPPDWQRLRP